MSLYKQIVESKPKFGVLSQRGDEDSYQIGGGKNGEAVSNEGEPEVGTSEVQA